MYLNLFFVIEKSFKSRKYVVFNSINKLQTSHNTQEKVYNIQANNKYVDFQYTLSYTFLLNFDILMRTIFFFRSMF